MSVISIAYVDHLLTLFNLKVAMDNINNLPEDCLILILRHFSLQELICIRAVCSNWKYIIETVFCYPKRCLKLFESRLQIRTYHSNLIQFNLQDDEQLRFRAIGFGHDDDLYIDPQYLTNDLVYLLSQLFPNIRHLVYFIGLHTKFSELLTLLRQWPQLKGLSFCGQITFEDAKKYQSKICFTISQSLPVLTRLDLLVSNFFVNQDSLNGNSLRQMMSRIESLSFYFFPGYMQALLSNLSAPRQLHLRIFSITSLFLYELKQTIASNSHLKEAISQLRMSDIRECELLPFIALNFANLQSLDIEFSCFCKVSFV